MATEQAKRAIQKMLASGWERSQFSVRTERKYAGRTDTGKTLYEYGDALISLKNSSKEECLASVKAMADHGLHVAIFEFADGQQGYPHVYDVYWLKPGVYLQKETVTECEYGLHPKERIY